MTLKITADRISLKKNKISTKRLEDQIFEKLCSNHYFKDILYPFAVLGVSESGIISLGSTEKVVGRINYDFILSSSLREIVACLVGDQRISIEVKVAEKEFRSVEERMKIAILKREKEQKIQIEIDEQRQQGRCNLIPFPIKANKVRSDLTVERHALFASNTCKSNFRMHEKRIKDSHSGENIILRVEIGDRDGQVQGVLKQKHQGFFYKLAQIWAENNYHIEEEGHDRLLQGYFEISAYELVKRIRNNDAGHHYQSVMKLLREMATIRVVVKKIYADGNIDCEDFTLLSYSFSAKNFDENSLTSKPGGFSKIRIRFSEFVTANFLRKEVKSLMLTPYFSLRDKGRKGIAQLLYTMLDYELSSKEKFHISLNNLGARLGLTPYQYKSKRKEKLASSIEAVNGAEILDGNYKLLAYLVESEDRKDWVFITRRILI